MAGIKQQLDSYLCTVTLGKEIGVVLPVAEARNKISYQLYGIASGRANALYTLSGSGLDLTHFLIALHPQTNLGTG